MIAAIAGTVLIEADVEHPVQGALYTPMGTTTSANRAALNVAEERW